MNSWLMAINARCTRTRRNCRWILILSAVPGRRCRPMPPLDSSFSASLGFSCSCAAQSLNLTCSIFCCFGELIVLIISTNKGRSSESLIWKLLSLYGPSDGRRATLSVHPRSDNEMSVSSRLRGASASWSRHIYDVPVLMAVSTSRS